jgi:hypothetical protein
MAARFPLALLALSFPLAAGGEPVYRWTDEEGLHYSNDPAAVPPGVKPDVTGGAELDEVTTRPAQEPAAEPPANGRREADAAPRHRVEAEREPRGPSEADRTAMDRAEAERQRAESERSWREAFRAAREKIRELEAQLARDRAALADPTAAGMALARDPVGGVYPSPEYEETRARVQRNERELERARRTLEDLDREASSKAIPREWRR